MLSKLIDAELRTSESGKPYYVCTFESTTGDKNADTFITINGMRVLNPKAAAIRSMQLVKSLFPTEDSVAQTYAEMLDGFIAVKEADGEIKDEKGNVYTLEDFTFSLPLIYVTKPCSDVYPTSEVCYQNKAGEEKVLQQFNAVGYSKLEYKTDEKGTVVDIIDTNVWDDEVNGFSAEERIMYDVARNIDRGVYWLRDKKDANAYYDEPKDVEKTEEVKETVQSAPESSKPIFKGFKKP